MHPFKVCTFGQRQRFLTDDSYFHTNLEKGLIWNPYFPGLLEIVDIMSIIKLIASGGMNVTPLTDNLELIFVIYLDELDVDQWNR